MPPLPDFSHAVLESITIGPRRVVTLTLTPLFWLGTQGQRGLPVVVRLGGIVNFEEATAFFNGQHTPAEMAGLRYANGRVSKPGDLFMELIFEQVEVQAVIHCHSVTVTGGG